MPTIRLGDEAPNFQAQSSKGEIDFHTYLGNSWGILFSHPGDFTPVCTTELGMAAKYESEFDKRNVKMIGLSVDGLESHESWINDISETQQATVTFPIIGDEDKKIAILYDMIHPNANDKMTVRSLFIIDPAKKVRLMMTYPASVGRNFDEIIRVIDSLQLNTDYKVATPANWKNGEDCIILNSVPEDKIPELFPKGHTVVKPYLKTTPQPNL